MGDSSDSRTSPDSIHSLPGLYDLVISGIDSVDIKNPEEMDNVWAKELAGIRAEEREMNEKMVHGIDSGIAETPEMINNALDEMELEIHKTPPKLKTAHERGLALNSMYIQSKDFRLKFLRSVRFDPKLAAVRYFLCLEYLRDVFGEYALTRRLYITDLNKEALEYMKEGQYQLLPCRDCLGRRIIVFSLPNSEKQYSNDTMFMVYFYILLAIVSDDLSTQRNGLVFIVIMEKKKRQVNSDNALQRMRRTHRLLAATPLYWGAVHLCLPDEPIYRVFVSMFMAWIGQEGRKMLRIHRGNRIECHYRLQTFGIPIEDMPQMHTGHRKSDHVMRLISVRQAMDAFQNKQELINKKRRKRTLSAPNTIKPFFGIECPEVNFVILGPLAYKKRHHLANVAFHQIIYKNNMFLRYLQDRRDDTGEGMKQMVDDILYEACLHGLQFVKYDTAQGYYTEVIALDELGSLVEETLKQDRRKYLVASLAKQEKDKEDRSSPRPLLFDKSSDNTHCGGCLR